MSLPTGTVTFLFTDIEGSTRLLQRLGDQYADALEIHRSLLRTAFSAHDGVEVSTEGDSFFVAFVSADDGVAAAVAGQLALSDHGQGGEDAVRVRMGLHTGDALVRGEDYVGMAVHVAARIAATAHGGQIVVSEITKALAQRSLAAPGTTLDLGHHRLKDIPKTQRLHQVCDQRLPTDFPPLRSIERQRNSLPVELTTFVGRARELEELHKLLDRARLITIVGLGGSGKTRLAVEAARARLSLADLVWFVDLAQVGDASAIPSAIRSQLPGTTDERDASVAEELDRVVDTVGARPALLVLDNCEHIIDPAGEVARRLLEACPGLSVLATSREPFGIAGEQIWRMPPLTPADALALFDDRGDLARPGYRVGPEDRDLVTQLCAQLDGIPLAVELAAARLTVLTPSQISDRLVDRFALLASRQAATERHQTLAAVVEWSHDLLSEAERVLLRRLAVFAGGFTLEAAEAVCGDQRGGDVLDLLASLVDHSLVQSELRRTGARYSLLETIREYATRRLYDAGEHTAIQERHISWCLDLAAAATTAYQTADEAARFSEVVCDYDNVRVAFDTCMVTGRLDDAVRLATTTFRPLWRTGRVDECIARLRLVLALVDDESPARAECLGNLGIATMDLEEARRYLDEAIALTRASGDRPRLAVWLHAYGARVGFTDQVASEAALQESVALHLELAKAAGATWALGTLADHLAFRGEVDAARATYERCVELLRGDVAPSVAAGVGESLGRLARWTGDLDTAERESLRSLELGREMGDEWNVGLCLENLGSVELARGSIDEAGVLLRDALTRLWSLRQSWYLPECLESLAREALMAARFERAATILGASEGIRARVGMEVFPVSSASLASDRAAIIAALGNDVAMAVLEQGAALADAEIVELALQPLV